MLESTSRERDVALEVSLALSHNFFDSIDQTIHVSEAFLIRMITPAGPESIISE